MAEETSTPAPQAPEGIRAFDQNGQEVIIPREQWASQVLPNMLADARDKPDELYNLILNSLNAGFLAEVAEPAEHLYATDPIPARGACMWAIVLMQTGRADQAERVLSEHLANHGPDGSVLLNLAQLYAGRNETERADQTLWRALEAEPNLDNGLGWYGSLAAERAAAALAASTPEADQATLQQAGEQAGSEALLRVATLPGSWRAQLWLARGELHRNNLEAARELYRQALARAPRPVPGDFLMQMSGDLGGSGHLDDLLAFTAPEFVAELHGMPIGNNLIKAYVDTGDLERAAQVRDALVALRRPDFQEGLAFWDAEIARRRAPEASALPSQAQAQQVQVGLLRIDGPIWLPPHSPARPLFHAGKAQGPVVTFLGGTAEPPEDQEAQPMPALGDAIGRMTRSLPLFFAEQTDLRTAAQGRTLVPWAVSGENPGQPGGFVVSSRRWPDAVALQMVADPANRTDYIVTVHLDAEVEPWTAELAFLRTSDGARIGELQAEFDPASPDETHAGLMQLAQEVVDLLAVLGPAGAAAAYQVPAGASFPTYLARMEQLLAVRSTTIPGAAPMSAADEQAVLAGELALCQAEPQNQPVRLLLMETLAVLSQTNPAAAAEFRPTFQRLTSDDPIPALDQAFSEPVRA